MENRCLVLMGHEARTLSSVISQDLTSLSFHCVYNIMATFHTKSAYNSSPIYPRLNHIHIHFEHSWMTLAPTRIRSGSRRKSVSSALPVGTGLWRASHCYEPGDHGWPTNIYRYTRLLPRHSREKATSTRLEYLPGRRVNPYWLRSLANARHCTAPRYGGTPRSPCLVSSPKYHDGSLLYPPPSGSPSIRQNFLSPKMVFNLGDCSRHPGSSTVCVDRINVQFPDTQDLRS